MFNFFNNIYYIKTILFCIINSVCRATLVLCQKANAYHELGQQKPFACMSLKPGLGDAYYQEHKEEIWKQGYIQCTNGKKAQIPKYYEKMMEKENPERLWRIKQNRQRKAIEQKRLQLEGKDYKKQLETKERVTKKQTKKRGML